MAVNENEKLASVLLLNRSSHGSKARSRGAQSSINDAAIEEPAGCGVEATYCSRSPRQCTNGWFTPTLFALLPTIAVVLEDIVFDSLRNRDYRVALSQRQFVTGAHSESPGQWPVFREVYVLQIVDNCHGPHGADDRRREGIGEQHRVEACAV